MRVLLIHGLSRTPLSLFGLARDIRRAGHRGEPYAVVGRSLGGLIVRAALGHRPSTSPLPRHVIMLGTPSATFSPGVLPKRPLASLEDDECHQQPTRLNG